MPIMKNEEEIEVRIFVIFNVKLDRYKNDSK